jgi:hypothetical protein
VDRERQDFLAGTVFAAGAGFVAPDARPGDPLRRVPPLFTVYVNEDESTFGPAPQLAEAFRMLDEHGADKLAELLRVSTGWAVMDDPRCPLIKLKLEFHAPMSGSAAIVLLAANYAEGWKHIVDGGSIAITTIDRLNRATDGIDRRPSADGALTRRAGTTTFEAITSASIVLGIRSSPGIGYLMDVHGW